MNRPQPAASPVPRAGVLAHEVEGYLLAHTERERARQEAAGLCDRLPWLTTAQAQDLALHYTEQLLALTRSVLRATADRAGELRREYEEHYATLRRTLLRRHAVAASLLLPATGTVSATSALPARWDVHAPAVGTRPGPGPPARCQTASRSRRFVSGRARAHRRERRAIALMNQPPTEAL